MTTKTGNTASTTTSSEEMWRSKLGSNYPKSFMANNERKFLDELNALRKLPENRVCADCGGNQGTVWASVNLGVFLCMTCGSHHRSLGTHISKPKGCTGTYWWGPDEIERMKRIGNARAKNQLYGGPHPTAGELVFSTTSSETWKKYLVDKYVHHKFKPTNIVPTEHQQQEHPKTFTTDPKRSNEIPSITPPMVLRKPMATMPHLDNTQNFFHNAQISTAVPPPPPPAVSTTPARRSPKSRRVADLLSFDDDELFPPVRASTPEPQVLTDSINLISIENSQVTSPPPLPTNTTTITPQESQASHSFTNTEKRRLEWQRPETQFNYGDANPYYSAQSQRQQTSQHRPQLLIQQPQTNLPMQHQHQQYYLQQFSNNHVGGGGSTSGNDFFAQFGL